MENLATRVLAALLALATGLAAQEEKPPAKAAEPAKAEPAIALQLRCSDLWLTFAEALGAEYRKANPNASVTVSGGGSSAALSSLAAAKADVAITSRQATDEQLKEIRAKGFEPMEFVFGYEAIAIVVPKANPLPSLTLAQLADLYGKQGKTTKWSQLGVTLPDDRDAAVQIVGREPNSAPQEHFVTTVLGRRGALRDDVHTIGDTKDLVQHVAKTPSAIGFCPPDFVGDTLRIVPLAAKADGKPLLPGDAGYPLRRPVYAYFRDDPAGHTKRFVLSIRKSEAFKAAGLTPP